LLRSLVNPQSRFRMSLGEGRRLGKPRTRDEHAGGSDPVVGESLGSGAIDRVVHPEVIGVDDQQAADDG